MGGSLEYLLDSEIFFVHSKPASAGNIDGSYFPDLADGLFEMENQTFRILIDFIYNFYKKECCSSRTCVLKCHTFLIFITTLILCSCVFFLL